MVKKMKKKRRRNQRVRVRTPERTSEASRAAQVTIVFDFFEFNRCS